MVFGAVFAAILAVVAAADVEHAGSAREVDEDSVEGVDSADPGVVRPAPAEASPTAGAVTPAGKALADSAPLLLDRADRVNGWAIERLLEPSGEIVEHEVNRAGTVQSCRTVGSLFTLRVLEQKPGPAGGVVEVVRDASGALLRFAVGPDGEPRAVALLAPPPR